MESHMTEKRMDPVHPTSTAYDTMATKLIDWLTNLNSIYVCNVTLQSLRFEETLLK